jgi:RNA polymerase sigma-70 factor, ECF subfamily
MKAPERDDLEREIRRRCETGDLSAAASAAVFGYGPEIFGFLLALHRNEEDAQEVFSIFTERVWRGLERFGWECSFRTWAYTIARNASLTYRAGARRRAKRETALPEGSVLVDAVAELRSATLSFLKTAAKMKVAELRDALPEDDRVILSLRVDKKLSFADIARVMHGEEPLSDDALRKESARLRKRFQHVKERLVEMARREGVVGSAPKRP